MSTHAHIQTATSVDVPGIQALVAAGVLRGHLLPRSGAEIRANLHRWVVARQGRRVVGCLSLEPTEPTLWEVRSVCVAKAHRRHGLGQQLVEEALRRGSAARVPQLFAVTAAHALFEKTGFARLTLGAPEWAHVLRPIRPCYRVVIAKTVQVPQPALPAHLLHRSDDHGFVALAK